MTVNTIRKKRRKEMEEYDLERQSTVIYEQECGECITLSKIEIDAIINKNYKK